MKQHPIDDLFARNLQNHSLPLQKASWEEMQKRMNHRQARRPVYGWYAVAASVVLLLVASWIFWRQQDAGISTSETVARAKPGKLPERQSIPEEPLVAQNGSLTSVKPQIEKNKLSVIAPATTKQTNASQVEANIPEQLAVINTLPEEPNPIEYLAAEELAERQSAPGKLPEAAERTLVVQFNSVEAVADKQQEDNLTNRSIEGETKKRIRLGRLLRQIRKGEELDWQEAGLNAGNLMAKANRTVQQGKEKLLDSYETIREQTTNRNENNK